MTATKTETLTVRISPTVKDGLRTVAEREHRSLANMIEMMVLDYCSRNGVRVKERGVGQAEEKNKSPGISGNSPNKPLGKSKLA